MNCPEASTTPPWDVSIIIAVKNAGVALQPCLDSCANQSASPKEIIVIDGGSTDSTIDVIERNGDVLKYWESQPDRGVYEAWNKGLREVSGTWVCFLGADDRFAHRDALAHLVSVGIKGDADLVSGRVGLIDGKGLALRVVGRAWDWEQMKHHQVIAHPGMLHRRRLFERFGGFDARYRISGDYEFLLRLGPTIRSEFVDEIVVLMGHAGMSRRRIGKLLRESWLIQSRHPEIGPLRATLNFVDALAKATVRRILRLP